MSNTQIIAEIAQAHDGSLGILHSYIDALAKVGVDTIKFQTHIAEAESSHEEPFRINFSYEDKTRFDYWKRMSFSEEQWFGIKQHCEDVGVEFLSSPFSFAAVDLLERLDVNSYKIGSGEVTNLPILTKIGLTKKPVILSSGMNNWLELDNAKKTLTDSGASDISILQCTSSYPTPAHLIGLNVMSEIRERYPDVKIGLSEHSGEIFACLAATCLGADILEFHAVFHKQMFGPDTSSSLDINQIQELVNGVRAIEKMLNNPIDKNDSDTFNPLKSIFQKSLAVNKDLPKGHTLTFDDLETKKPMGFGIPANEFKAYLGLKLNKSIQKYNFLTTEYFT